MATQYHPASVDQDQLETIQELEKDIGKVVVAMDSDQNDYADLSGSQLAHLQAVEKKLGVVIVAFDS